MEQNAGIAEIAACLDEVMQPDQQTMVLLETMSGKGSEVGGRFEELRAIIDTCRYGDLLGVCRDTCHVSDAGYGIVHDLDGVLAEFDRVIGLSRLRALRSERRRMKNPCGAHKDRHERIGCGYLGEETFRRIVNHPALHDLPMILETPNQLPGYAAEIALLRGFCAGFRMKDTGILDLSRRDNATLKKTPLKGAVKTLKEHEDRKYIKVGLTALAVIFISILLVVIFTNLPGFFAMLQALGAILEPLIFGVVIAFLLNPIVRFFDTRLIPLLEKHTKWKPTAIRHLQPRVRRRGGPHCRGAHSLRVLLHAPAAAV